MKYLEPNIVVVDDIQDEVIGIIKHYVKQGLGCKYFNSSQYDGDEYPDKKFSDVTLFFLDLYYSEMAFDAELCASWVQSIIPEKSFYILVLWTRDRANAESVLEILSRHNLTPFCCLEKSKVEYQMEGEERYDYGRLFNDINRELDNLPALEEIQIWKKSVRLSSNEVLGHLTKTIDPANFNNKLKKIIISHGGTSVKTNTDFQRKRIILFDALDNILISNTRNCIIDGEISDINKLNLYDLSVFADPGMDKELNSWFHFKLEKDLPEDLIYPGLISVFKDNIWKTNNSIHDDQRVRDYINRQNAGNTLITSIVLLLSRPCDIAQKKYGKNLKLISGLKIVNPVRRANQEFHGGSVKPDSITIYDHLYFGNEETDVTLLFDFRYVFSVPEDVFRTEFDNIKIFNKELLSDMQVGYSSYSSRLGITQIL
jgi:hypothetical protein